VRGYHASTPSISLALFKKLLIGVAIGLSVLGTQSSFAQGRCDDVFTAEAPAIGSWRPGSLGEILSYKGSTTEQWSPGRKLRIAEYNMYNIGEYALSEANEFRRNNKNLPQNLRYKPKSIARIAEQGRTMLRANADIIVCPEVQGAAAAKEFSRRFLEDKYDVLYIKGNDVRGMDIVYLVKKNLPIEIEYVSNRQARAPPNKGIQELIFSRDLPMAIVYAKGNREKPLFVLAGTHFKSKMNVRPEHSKGIEADGEGNRLRTHQVHTSIKILEQVYNYFGQKVPVFIAGDFNNNLNGQNEMMGYPRAGYKDVFDISPNVIKHQDRVTHAYFSRGGEKDYKQVDGILVLGSQFIKVVESGIVPYLFPDGKQKPLPRNFNERETNPSDHWMIFADVIFD
jgi:hypothetical protein